MTRKEVIEFFCQLSSTVGDSMFTNKYAYDCFCSTNLTLNYQFDSAITEFIQKAVEEKIEREVK